MGVQSGITQVLNSAAAGAALGKHIHEQSKAEAEKIEQAKIANIKAEEANRLSEEANELEDKNLAIKAADNINPTVDRVKELEYNIGLNNQAIKDTEAKIGKTKSPFKVGKMKYSITTMQEANERMALERDAKKMQAEIYRDQINKIGSKGKDMGIYTLPWEGGKK